MAWNPAEMINHKILGQHNVQTQPHFSKEDRFYMGLFENRILSRRKSLVHTEPVHFLERMLYGKGVLRNLFHLKRTDNKSPENIDRKSHYKMPLLRKVFLFVVNLCHNQRNQIGVENRRRFFPD